uniref:SGNH hydrolase-type esterase domain-containing protein n=1 Tax=Kryptolebias marmoratus TaxID=37003 RepID=A0A3Q2ZXH4_KRYMA
MPKVLIVGDSSVNGIDHLCNKNKTKVLCFSKDTVSDVTEKIVPLTTDHPSIENLIIHTGANDLAKKQSEILKKDFSHLLSTLGNLKIKVLISGPILKPGRGDENYTVRWEHAAHWQGRKVGGPMAPWPQWFQPLWPQPSPLHLSVPFPHHHHHLHLSCPLSPLWCWSLCHQPGSEV